jgi:hypothetical protein
LTDKKNERLDVKTNISRILRNELSVIHRLYRDETSEINENSLYCVKHQRTAEIPYGNPALYFFIVEGYFRYWQPISQVGWL